MTQAIMNEMIEDSDVKVKAFEFGGVSDAEFSEGEHKLIRMLYKEMEKSGNKTDRDVAKMARTRILYRTEKLDVVKGKKPLVYRDIPLNEKETLFKALFLFSPCPKMDDMVLDIHEGKLFRFGDAMIIHEPWNGYNYLVSPYYAMSGGMAVDMVGNSDEEVTMRDAQCE